MNRLTRRQLLETAGLAAGAAIVRPAAAASPALTLTGADYLRYTPIATGDLRPKDFALTWIRGERNEMLNRAASDPAVSGGEASMLRHLVRVDRGDRSLVAVPVFLLRNFTARDIYVRKGSSLTPGELSGRTVGIYNWTASGAVWYRHLVRYFGANPATMKWLVGGTDQPSRVEASAPLPPHVTDAPADKSLSDLLLAGTIDALFTPLPPKLYHAAEGPIVRLVPDFPSVEKRYFQETRCYPPQHVLVLRKEVWEGNPGIGTSLVELFDRCEVAFQEGQHLFPYSSPWLMAELEECDRVMGPGYHAHGLEKNRHQLEVFCQSAFEDGLTKKRVTVEEYFEEFRRS